MGSKSSAPPPPDYSGIAQASEKSAELAFKLGQDQLEWAKEQYGLDREIADRVINSALDIEAANAETARKDRERYEQVYQPVEDKMVQEAMEYDTPQRREMEMGRASATVAQNFNSQRQAALQQLEGFGVDPSSLRYASLDIGARAAQAAAQAGAANQAGQLVDATGRALRSEAINVGRGYPGSVAQTYGTALDAGRTAVDSTLSTTASGANTMGTAPQYMGLGNQALGVWGNTLNMGYQNQLAAHQANQQASSGWGTALGLIGGLAVTPLKGTLLGKPLGFEGGGAVPEEVSPSRGAIPDDVNSVLTAGEFVVPDDVVRWKGEEFFQKVIEKSRSDKPNAPAKPAAAIAQPGGPAFVSQALPM